MQKFVFVRHQKIIGRQEICLWRKVFAFKVWFSYMKVIEAKILSNIGKTLKKVFKFPAKWVLFSVLFAYLKKKVNEN